MNQNNNAFTSRHEYCMAYVLYIMMRYQNTSSHTVLDTTLQHSVVSSYSSYCSTSYGIIRTHTFYTFYVRYSIQYDMIS